MKNVEKSFGRENHCSTTRRMDGQHQPTRERRRWTRWTHEGASTIEEGSQEDGATYLHPSTSSYPVKKPPDPETDRQTGPFEFFFITNPWTLERLNCCVPRWVSAPGGDEDIWRGWTAEPSTSTFSSTACHYRFSMTYTSSLCRIRTALYRVAYSWRRSGAYRRSTNQGPPFYFWPIRGRHALFHLLRHKCNTQFSSRDLSFLRPSFLRGGPLQLDTIFVSINSN